MQLLHDLNPDNLLIEEQAVEYTKSLGVALNLQSHTVQVSQDRRVRIYLAAAVEIHMDKNTQTMYLSSLKDILPLDCHNSLHKTEALQRGCRLRPEFLKAYQHSLCSGALTPTSGATKTEVETNDAALIRASRFLRESWIPGFIKSLDILDIRPFDSRSLTVEMHQKGINMRYLGMICERSAVPFVRNLALTEMVARASKHAFQSRLREAILHFRSVGATNIEREMEVYAVGFFTLILSNTDKSRTYFHSQIQPDLAEMFNYTLSEKQYANIHRPALFLALQYHVISINVVRRNIFRLLSLRFHGPQPASDFKFHSISFPFKNPFGSSKSARYQPTRGRAAFV